MTFYQPRKSCIEGELPLMLYAQFVDWKRKQSITFYGAANLPKTHGQSVVDPSKNVPVLRWVSSLFEMLSNKLNEEEM
jgi:hypothetical protein